MKILSDHQSEEAKVTNDRLLLIVGTILYITIADRRVTVHYICVSPRDTNIIQRVEVGFLDKSDKFWIPYLH